MVFLFQSTSASSLFQTKIIEPNKQKNAMTQAACHGHAAGAACGDFQVSGGDEGRDLSAGERGVISRVY
jgi:hypothetical protein